MDMSRVKEDERPRCVRVFNIVIACCWQDGAGRTEVRVKYTVLVPQGSGELTHYHTD